MEALVLLRNSWVNAPLNRPFPNDFFTNIRSQIANLWPKDKNETVAKCLVVILQILANAAVGSEIRQASIWAELFPTQILTLLGRPSLRIFCLSCAVIHQCTVDSAARCKDLTTDGGILAVAEIVGRLQVADVNAVNAGIEWALFIVESLVKRGYVAETLHSLCKLPQGQALGIAWLMTLAHDLVESDQFQYDLKDFLPLIDDFIDFVEKVRQREEYWVGGEEADGNVRNWGAAWLRLWCSITSKIHDDSPARLELIKRMTVPSSTMLVRARKEWAVEKPRHGHQIHDIHREYEAHASADWVRLVGNLVYRCQIAQDIVRENEGLVALLNFCQLDERNPVIKEWYVLL